jgi:signal transduction histidine kinase
VDARSRSGPPSRERANPAAFVARAVQRALYLPLFLTALFAIAVVGQVLWLRSSMARVERTTHALAAEQRVSRSLVEGQASVRGFLLTGSDRFLQQMEAAYAQLPSAFAALDAEARREPGLAPTVTSLREDVTRWQGHEKSTVALYRAGGDVIGAELEDDGVLEAARARIQGRVDSLERERDARESRVQLCTEVTLAAVAALAVALGVAIAAYVRRDLLGVGREYAGALEQAARARDEAEEANRLKDEFLVTIGHELRTPLNAIMGWTALLRRRPEDPQTRGRAIEVIDRNARAQAKLVEDMLDVSRIVSGQLQLRVEQFDLGSAVGAAVASLGPAARAKGLRVDVAVEPEAKTIAGDPKRLQQAVWNLVANAVKFTPAEGHVTVIARRASEHTEIRVADTGPGVSAEFAPRLFERFQRGDNSPTRRYGGVGLGLAIVRHLVELHGGTVHVESPGEEGGATFVVLLPVERDAVGAERGEPRSLEPHRVGGDHQPAQGAVAGDGGPTKSVADRGRTDGARASVTPRWRGPTGRTSVHRSRGRPV